MNEHHENAVTVHRLAPVKYSSRGTINSIIVLIVLASLRGDTPVLKSILLLGAYGIRQLPHATWHFGSNLHDQSDLPGTTGIGKLSSIK